MSSSEKKEVMGRKERKLRKTGKTLAALLWEYFLMTLAAVILDVGIYVFKFPNHFSFGGVSGLAVVAAAGLPFSESQINLVVNMLLLLIGFLFLGKGFGVKTTYVTVVSSVLLDVMEHLFPMSQPLTDDPMLELVYAIVLPAIAAALLFYENASSGGTDIIAMILKKHSTMDLSAALLWVDAVIVLISCFVFDIRTGLFSICGLLAKTLVIDKAMERMKMNKYFTIVCCNPEPICEYIMTDLGRSATVYKAEGAYSHQDKRIILTAMDPRQAVYLERFIKKVEPDAFYMVTKSSEVIGKGFRAFL